MELSSGFFFSTIEKISNWASAKSLWPLACGTSCCAIEMMHAAASKFDLDQFGCLFRASPRQADLLIISGTITKKMLPNLLTLYDQMLEPKYVIAMGSCAICGGLFSESQTVVSNLHEFLKIDIKVPGCPPSAETLASAILNLQQKIRKIT